MDVATKAPGAADIIQLLDLRPHPEGGHFRETFRDETRVHASAPGAGPGPGPGQWRQGEGARAASTAIYFLLARGERSHWHRIDAVEIWHHYAGAPLELAIAAGEGGPITRLCLGTNILAGERPQAMVPAHAWQAAASLGDWTLAGCTVAPGFEFDGFEMAPPEWTP